MSESTESSSSSTESTKSTNETKLQKVTERYQVLKSIAAVSPVISTFFDIVILALLISILPPILNIQVSQSSMPARDQHRDSIELQVLNKLDQILDQRRLDQIADSVKNTIHLNKN